MKRKPGGLLGELLLEQAIDAVIRARLAVMSAALELNAIRWRLEEVRPTSPRASRSRPRKARRR